MNRLGINRQLFRLVVAGKWVPILIGFWLWSVDGTAQQQAPPQSGCRQSQSMVDSSTMPIVVSIKDLRENPEQYFGKTVTVDGKLHRTFTNNVFTIEDSEFPRDHDILIISTVPQPDAVIPLEHSVERGKGVRVTGVVQPYDRGKLECAYGPLHLESREGHSFTKNPVVIIDKTQSAKLEMPRAALEKPTTEPAAPEAPKPEMTAPEPPKTETTTPEPPKTEAAPEQTAASTPEPSKAAKKSMPKTATELPLLALAGVLSLCGAWIKSKL